MQDADLATDREQRICPGEVILKAVAEPNWNFALRKKGIVRDGYMHKAVR